EAGSLVGAVHIDDAAVLQRSIGGFTALALVRHDTDGHAAQPSITAYQSLAVFRLVLVERPGVEKTRQQVADVIFLARFRMEQRAEISGGPAARRGCRYTRALLRQGPDQAAKPLKALRIVRLAEV